MLQINIIIIIIIIQLVCISLACSSLYKLFLHHDSIDIPFNFNMHIYIISKIKINYLVLFLVEPNTLFIFVVHLNLYV